MMGLYLDCLPEELWAGTNHVNWRYEGHTKTKVLKIAGTFRNASSTNPRTWRTLRECVEAMERHPGRYAGVGRVIVREDPYVGVDLDDVRDPESGKLSPRAAEIVRKLDSYAEVSPSQAGVKLWVRAGLERAYKKPGLELYPHRRYFTLTGCMLPHSLPTVEERQDELETLIQEEFAEAEKKPSRPYEGVPGERIDLVEFLSAAGVEILGEIPDGSAARVFRIVCPWMREHTRGDRSGTRAGQFADGALFFHCEHAHCAQRRWAQFRDYLSPPAMFLRRRSRARRVRGAAQ